MRGPYNINFNAYLFARLKNNERRLLALLCLSVARIKHLGSHRKYFYNI
jgi:hypothetical protein